MWLAWLDEFASPADVGGSSQDHYNEDTPPALSPSPCHWRCCLFQASEVSNGSGGNQNNPTANDINAKLTKNSTAGQHMTLASPGGRPDGSSKTGPNQLAESTYFRSPDAPNPGEVQSVRLGGRAVGLAKLLGRDENKRQLITAGSRLLQVQPFAIDVYVPSQQLWFDF